MAMEQWSPFRDMLSLRDAMDQLFQSSYVSPRGMIGGRGGTTNGMPLDVTEHDNGYQIEASMPGVNPDDVQITVRGDTLTIRGEVSKTENVTPQQMGEQGQQTPGQTQAQQSQQTQANQGHGKQQSQDQQSQQSQQGQQRQHEHALARERFYGTYLRQVTLPTTVNADKAKAHFKNGILYLTLPKAEEAKPRQIPVSSQSQEVHHILTPAEQRQQQQQQGQSAH